MCIDAGGGRRRQPSGAAQSSEWHLRAELFTSSRGVHDRTEQHVCHAVTRAANVALGYLTGLHILRRPGAELGRTNERAPAGLFPDCASFLPARTASTSPELRTRLPDRSTEALNSFFAALPDCPSTP
jgi:hypothetical protein